MATGSTRRGRASIIAFETIVALTVSIHWVHAQHAPVRPDSAPAPIDQTLRAFYFNLAHNDWEALTADILAAKVVAHRPAPEALIIAASPASRRRAGGSGGSSIPADPTVCSSTTAALVEQAAILLDGDWAEAFVPRCIAGSSGTDEFRLINFERRWRIVYIDLFKPPVRETEAGAN